MPRTRKQSSQTGTPNGNRWTRIRKRVSRALWAGLLLFPTWLNIAHALPSVQVLAGTELQVVLSRDHESEEVPQEAAGAVVTLLSDAGTPLADQPIVIEFDLGHRSSVRTLTTDRLGRVELTVPAGTRSMAAHYAGQEGYAPSVAPLFRFETPRAGQQAARFSETDTLGLWPWLASLLVLGGLAWLRASRTKPRRKAPQPGGSQAPRPRAPDRAPLPRPAPEAYAVVLDADLGLPIAGACMVTPDGTPNPLSTSDQRGRLRLPQVPSTSAYLVQAEGYESRTVFAGQLDPTSSGPIVLPLRNLRSALWERLQRTAGVAPTAAQPSAQRSPAQWAARHGPGAGPALTDIEQALFAAAPLNPTRVDDLDTALKRALSSGRGPMGPGRPADDR